MLNAIWRNLKPLSETNHPFILMDKISAPKAQENFDISMYEALMVLNVIVMQLHR